MMRIVIGAGGASRKQREPGFGETGPLSEGPSTSPFAFAGACGFSSPAFSISDWLKTFSSSVSSSSRASPALVGEVVLDGELVAGDADMVPGRKSRFMTRSPPTLVPFWLPRSRTYQNPFLYENSQCWPETLAEIQADVARATAGRRSSPRGGAGSRRRRRSEPVRQ